MLLIKVCMSVLKACEDDIESVPCRSEPNQTRIQIKDRIWLLQIQNSFDDRIVDIDRVPLKNGLDGDPDLKLFSSFIHCAHKKRNWQQQEKITTTTTMQMKSSAILYIVAITSLTSCAFGEFP